LLAPAAATAAERGLNEMEIPRPVALHMIDNN
jgi:hypothetical protein